MVLGALVFGTSMQIILGCRLGALINAGSGSSHAFFVLLFFAFGSFAGAFVLKDAAAISNMGIHILQHGLEVVINLISSALVSGVCCFYTIETFHS